MPGNPNYAGAFTTAIENRTRKLADNVGKNNALLYKLREKGKIKTVSGGTKILQEIDYTENTSSGWYSGWDVLTVAPTDTLTAAEFAIKEAYVTMAISGLEMAQNSMRYSWLREEVDDRLRVIMKSIHKSCVSTAERFGTPGNYVNGANIAGFIKVADSMLDQGVV